MPPASTRCAESGGRRVYHLGNAAISVMAFLITLVLSMSVLDPQRGSFLLSERFRPPPIGFTESVVINGFTAVEVRANKRTLLVVPAAGIHGVRHVSRALDSFFSVALGADSHANAAVKNTEEKAEMPSPPMITLADVYSTVLLRGESADAAKAPDVATGAVATVPLSSRRPFVLHLCSALACVTPFITQQWSDRAQEASLVGNKTTDPATTVGAPARPVTNLALVFGEASESLAVMRELEEHRVLTAQIPYTHSNHLSAMPLIGKLEFADVEASCSSLRQCRYRSPVKHAHLATVLKAQADQLPTEDSRKRLFKEWLWHNATPPESSPWCTVDVFPFAFAVFEGSYTLDDVPLDLVHVDVGSSDSVASLAYLEALASATAKPPHLQPRNLLVSIFASEWVNDMVDMLLRLETGQGYRAIPLHKSCIGFERSFASRERWSMSHMKSWMDKSALEGTYLSPFLDRSRAAQIPLCTVLLSRQVDSLDVLLKMVSNVIGAYPPATSPVERFLYHSVGLSPEDEEFVTPLPNSAADPKASSMASTSRGVRGVMEFAIQHIYLGIPIGVGVLLTRNICRRRGACG
ncbi:hypothetical protein GH5_00116 [Leishmania sp. Ghana 2012 LV757]|uniref:hypothetical protein n=1 Tax=Leishmania sp. Ghana 2012 LV757 TaxID=2803181 RepID=UPI001B74E072|nr:hypothetical protein GH5_00116 [Leishmania sp. Ghana 2012 LV757]